MRRAGVAALLLVVLLVAPARPQERRILIPIEEFLPRETSVFVTVPSGRAALNVLARAGEDEAALAARLTEIGGGEKDAAPVLAALAAAAAGPVSFARVPERIPGRPAATALVVALGSPERDDSLLQAVGETLRSVFAPTWFTGVREETIMSQSVFHFEGPERSLYLTEGRGYVLVCTSAFTLGRILRDFRSPSGRTLKYDAAFEAARAGTNPGDGFLFVRPEGFPEGFQILGARWASGVFVDDGQGVRDELRIASAGEGLLADVVAGGPAPGGWKGVTGQLWFGLALQPAGAARLAVALLPSRATSASLMVDGVVAGPAEALWGPEAGARIRYRMKEGGGLPPHGFGDLGRVVGGDLLVARTAEAVAAAPAPGEGEIAGAAGQLRAPLAVLLAALGVADGPDQKSVVWRIGKEEDAVVVTTGRLETGPFAAIVAALTR